MSIYTDAASELSEDAAKSGTDTGYGGGSKDLEEGQPRPLTASISAGKRRMLVPTDGGMVRDSCMTLSAHQLS